MTTTTTTTTVNARVITKNGHVGTVLDSAKGWVTVQADNGTIIKARTSGLTLAPESTEPKEPKGKRPVVTGDIIGRAHRNQYEKAKVGKRYTFDCGDTLATAARGLDLPNFIKLARKLLRQATATICLQM